MSNGIKIVALGESTTGKSSIAYRLAKHCFCANMESTIGASFLTVNYNGTRYEIWDTAGQDRFLSLVQMYYRNADLILMVYDVSKPTSINRFAYYLDKIVVELKNEYRIIVIGNKTDLVKQSDITYADNLAREALEQYDSIKGKTEFVTISAKTADNFDALVEKITRMGTELTDLKRISTDDEETDSTIIKLDQKPSIFNNSYCSC